MLNEDGTPTKAAAAVLEWKKKLEDYPVADEGHYSELEYNEFVEWLEAEFGREYVDDILEWVSDTGLPFSTEQIGGQDYEDLENYVKELELRKRLAEEFGEKNVEVALEWIEKEEMVYDLDEWDEAELEALYRYMAGRRPYTEEEERALGQRWLWNKRKRRTRRTRRSSPRRQ
jgi:hypothetical protein